MKPANIKPDKPNPELRQAALNATVMRLHKPSMAFRYNPLAKVRVTV
jgi:hypothetical protein